MDTNSFIKRIDETIDEKWPEMVAMSDAFAAAPEISGREFKTSRKLVDVLEEAGFDVEYPYMGLPTAFKAKAGRKGNGGRAAILVEYDALPDVGHACGHNLHGSMSILAALSLLPLMKEIEGELLVIGTPAEESDGAKVKMAAEGAFDGCDFAMMIHSNCGFSAIHCNALAMDALEFTFIGTPAHAAAAPWEGRNALNGLQLFFHAIDMLRQHVKPEARMHGVVVNGGSVPNVVPDKAVGHFYFRAATRGYLDKMLELIYNCARGAALATNTDVEWRNFEASFKDMLHNKPAEQMITDIFEEVGVSCKENTDFGSSDVGDVTYHCPALQPLIDISGGVVYPGHTPEFAKAAVSEEGHEAMKKGARIIARAILRALTEPELRAQMWDDFKKELEAGKE